MRKVLVAIFVLVASVTTVWAKSGKDSDKRFNVSIQGGALISVNENYFSYGENGQFAKLITPQGALAFGYDFSNRFGSRLSVSYGLNASACNTRQTSGYGFFPYSFQSVNVFADAILNLGKRGGAFHPKLYMGVGMAYSFGFTDSGHPWQVVNDRNSAFGFRGGFIGVYNISNSFGIFVDLCGEAYTDDYNGLQPSEADQSKVEGYAGLPLDLRGVASLGILFRF